MAELKSGRDWAFLMECPSCNDSAGQPYRAETLRVTNSPVRVSLKCRECGHEWQADLLSEPNTVPSNADEPDS